MDTIKAYKNKAMGLVEVDVEKMVELAQKRAPAAGGKLCEASVFAIVGFLVGVLTTFYLIFFVAPLDVEFGVDHTDMNPYACVLKGQYGCLPTNSTWTHVKYIYEGGFSYSRPAIEREHLMNNLTPLTVVALILKTIGLGCLGALVFVAVNEARKGLQSASRPVAILGSMLNSWVIQKKATTTQLEAWYDARQSILYNEVAMTLDKFENAISGYLFLAVLGIGIEAIRITFLKHPAHMIILPGSFFMIFVTYVCVLAALQVETEQRKHIELLDVLKASLTTSSPEQIRLATACENKAKLLEKSDYQARLFFLPLNRKLVMGMVTYFSATTGTVLYGLFMQD